MRLILKQLRSCEWKDLCLMLKHCCLSNEAEVNNSIVAVFACLVISQVCLMTQNQLKTKLICVTEKNDESKKMIDAVVPVTL